MTEQDKTAQFVFTVVVIPDNNRYEIELWDFAGAKPDLIAAGEGTNWRTALGRRYRRSNYQQISKKKP